MRAHASTMASYSFKLLLLLLLISSLALAGYSNDLAVCLPAYLPAFISFLCCQAWGGRMYSYVHRLTWIFLLDRQKWASNNERHFVAFQKWCSRIALQRFWLMEILFHVVGCKLSSYIVLVPRCVIKLIARPVAVVVLFLRMSTTSIVHLDEPINVYVRTYVRTTDLYALASNYMLYFDSLGS